MPACPPACPPPCLPACPPPCLPAPLPARLPVYQVGVGTSRLQEDMVRNGYENIVNIDTSNTAIAHMKLQHKALPELVYQQGDVR